jgi:GT2 family glycosyltransferase
MANNQDIKISIIIPTYNREEILPQTVDLILKSDLPNCELILIHQRPRSSGQFQKFLERTEDRIRYFAVDWTSVTRACNFGVKQAQGEIVLMLDDDIIPYSGLAPAHLKNYQSPRIGAVAGKILIPHPVKFPEHVGRIGGLGPRHETFVSSERQYVQTGGGGNMSFRRSVFDKVGGFDTNYIQNAHRFESDFCFRLRKLGYLIVYDPEAVIKHLEFKSGGIRSWKKEANLSSSFFRNEMLFYFKNRPDCRLGRYLWLNLSQVVPSRNLKIFFWRSWAFLYGILWGAWVYLTKYKFASFSKTKSRKN